MKTSWSIAVATVCVSVWGAYGASQEVDGITWQYQECAGGVEICEVSSTPTIAGDISIPSVLDNKPVAVIGNGVFSGSSGLKSVTIPEGIRSIGDRAFYDCSGLTSVTIPSSVTNIGEYAFRGCSGLTSVTIPEGVTSIDGHTFSRCSGLKSVTIPSSVTSIGDWAFTGCSGLTSVKIPDGVTSIGLRVFNSCSGLKSVTIPSSVTSIGEYAFSGCEGLGDGVVIRDGWVLTVNGECPSVVEIPEGTRGIVGGAFNNCNGLTSVTIPSSVTSIGDYSFNCCSALTSATVDCDIPISSECVFNGCSQELVIHAKGNPLNWIQFDGHRVVFDDYAPPAVTNYVYITVTNEVFHHDVVTNVVEHFTTVTNVVQYVPAPGTSPAAQYSLQAGNAAAQFVAGGAGWDALGLPEGMTWDKTTGTLGGMPVKSGIYDVFLVSGSGADTKMMRTTLAVDGFAPIVGYVGVDFAWTGAPVSLFASYKNLPDGLKWTASAATLAGVPAKVGDFSRPTTYGDDVSFTIKALPATSVGTFNGVVDFNGTKLPLVVTTTAAGKPTAKITSGSKTVTYSAKSWNAWQLDDEGRLVLTGALATKKDTLTLVIRANDDWTCDAAAITVTGGTLEGASGTAQRNAYGKTGKTWENAAAHDFAARTADTYTFDAENESANVWRLVPPAPAGKTGALKVAIKDTGAASISGKLNGKSYSASTTLRSDGTLFFYVKGVAVSGQLHGF